METKGIILFAIIIAAAVQITTAVPLSEANYLSMRSDQIQQNLRFATLSDKLHLMDKCYNVTGDYTTYREVAAAQERAGFCLQLTISTVILDHLKKQTIAEEEETPQEQIINIGRGLCSKSSEMLQCIKSYTKVLGKCFDDKNKETMKKSIKGVKAVGEYMCKDDAEWVVSFVNNHGPDCFQSNLPELGSCIDNLNSQTEFLNPFSEGGNDKNCSLLQQFLICTADTLKTCENKKPSELVRGFFNESLIHSECSNYTI